MMTVRWGCHVSNPPFVSLNLHLMSPKSASVDYFENGNREFVLHLYKINLCSFPHDRVNCDAPNLTLSISLMFQYCRDIHLLRLHQLQHSAHTNLMQIIVKPRSRQVQLQLWCLYPPTMLQVETILAHSDANRWALRLTFVTFAEAGTHGLSAANQLSVHHGGGGRREGKGGGEERGSRGRRSNTRQKSRVGGSERWMSWRLMHRLTSLYGRGEVREQHWQSEGRGGGGAEKGRKLGRKLDCLFADEGESPPLLCLPFSSHCILPLSSTVFIATSVCTEGMFRELRLIRVGIVSSVDKILDHLKVFRFYLEY